MIHIWIFRLKMIDRVIIVLCSGLPVIVDLAKRCSSTPALELILSTPEEDTMGVWIDMEVTIIHVVFSYDVVR